MKGLELCRLYYEEVGAPELKARFPELMSRAAVGLSGQGSDCLGFDDEFSRDHDYGPGLPHLAVRRGLRALRRTAPGRL